MARGRELSQLGSLITVEDSTKNIGVAAAAPSQKVGIGTSSPTSKVEVVGDVLVSGIITSTSFSGDGSGLTGVASTDNIQTATSANFLSNVNIAGITTCQALTVSGSLTVDGTTTTINSTTLTVDDKTIVIASGAADSNAADGAGISIDGASASILYSHSGTKFVSNKSFEATSFVGDVTGNADTATTLETARTIAGVSFDGSSNISLNNNAITNGAGYITTSHAFTNTNQLTNGAGFITSSGTAALAEGLTGTPDITVGTITATSFSGDGSGLTGVASTDNIQTATKATFLSGVTVAGVTTTSSNVNVTGNVTVTGDVSATNFNSSSDITLKQDVSVIDNALEMISQLEGVSWKWKESLKPSLGVTAQNVETVAPELVSNGDHKSVNYNGLIGISIEAVKELKSEVDELKR